MRKPPKKHRSPRCLFLPPKSPQRFGLIPSQKRILTRGIAKAIIGRRFAPALAFFHDFARITKPRVGLDKLRRPVAVKHRIYGHIANIADNRRRERAQPYIPQVVHHQDILLKPHPAQGKGDMLKRPQVHQARRDIDRRVYSQIRARKNNLL